MSQTDIEAELSINLSELKNAEFECKVLISAFHQSACKTDESIPQNNDVSIKEYCIAYKEIIKFLNKLGAVFYFVVSDISEKVVILENFLEENPLNYETIQSV